MRQERRAGAGHHAVRNDCEPANRLDGEVVLFLGSRCVHFIQHQRAHIAQHRKQLAPGGDDGVVAEQHLRPTIPLAEHARIEGASFEVCEAPALCGLRVHPGAGGATDFPAGAEAPRRPFVPRQPRRERCQHHHDTDPRFVTVDALRRLADALLVGQERSAPGPDEVHPVELVGAQNSGNEAPGDCLRRRQSKCRQVRTVHAMRKRRETRGPRHSHVLFTLPVRRKLRYRLAIHGMDAGNGVRGNAQAVPDRAPRHSKPIALQGTNQHLVSSPACHFRVGGSEGSGRMLPTR